MSKNKEKKTKRRRKFNALAINMVAEKLGYSDRYIRSCLEGTAKGLMSDVIVNEYKALDNEITNVVNKYKKTKVSRV